MFLCIHMFIASTQKLFTVAKVYSLLRSCIQLEYISHEYTSLNTLEMCSLITFYTKHTRHCYAD